MKLQDLFSKLTAKATHLAGSLWAFVAASVVVLGWLITGPVFGFSANWMLFINTVTTIVTFLMVFLIQHAQNKENRAVQMKLNELIAATLGASNRLIAAEELMNGELQWLHKRFKHLAETAQKLEKGAQTSIDKDEDDD